MEICIFGEIVDTEVQKTSVEDVCPSDIKAQLDQLKDGEELYCKMNSVGGSVTSGI